MPKPNLVIVHSFPTNSLLLKGLKEFLEDFFKVYFIDLPGFNVQVTPLKKISFDNYSKYVEDYIGKLKIKNYFLGGVSFGFFVVNNCKLDDRCKGFFAIEPYINANYLKQGFMSGSLMKIFLFFVTNFRLHNYAYNSLFFKRFLLSENPKKRIETMLKTIDGYTFFETAKITLSNNTPPFFHKKPYILIINEKDHALCAKEIISLFENLNHKLIVKTKAEHYPKNLTKKYFQRTVDSEDVKRILNFCNSI